MGNHKPPQSQGTNDVEWNKHLALDLGLPQIYTQILDEIMAGVSAYCTSIVLFGSWAEGTSTNQSDLDILFIAKDEDDKNTAMTVLEGLLSETRSQVYDCKVLSMNNILRLSEGPQHFAIWLMLTTGVVLNGSNLSNFVKLEHERVRTLMNELLERINDCISSIESNIHYTGACVQTAYITRTLYFVETHLLKNGPHHERKQEYIKRLLGPSYTTIERLYSEVALTR